MNTIYNSNKRKPSRHQENYDCNAWAKYRECANQWRRLTQQQELKLEENIITSNDLAAFYRFNKRSSNRTRISAITDTDGTTYTLLIVKLLIVLTNYLHLLCVCSTSRY